MGKFHIRKGTKKAGMKDGRCDLNSWLLSGKSGLTLADGRFHNRCNINHKSKNVIYRIYFQNFGELSFISPPIANFHVMSTENWAATGNESRRCPFDRQW
jgi:hypothetical protein